MKKSVTIIISHYESLPFLRRCLKQIEKYKNPDIEQRVLVLDQSHSVIYGEMLSFLSKYEVNNNLDFILCMKELYSGYGIDYAMRHCNINTDYICQLHADAFPINKNWLSMPIALMEEKHLAFTGVLQFHSDKPESIYPPNKGVFAMAQCFNIGRTDVYKEMSLEAGFTRFHNRPQSGLEFKNNDWAEWAKGDYNARGSDDDVPAFVWLDNHREYDKMSFGFTGIMGTGDEPNYGTIIEDMVFHFGYHREGLGVMPQMGSKYAEWTRRINENYSDELLEEMLVEARKHILNSWDGRKLWDGKTNEVKKVGFELHNKIQRLK